MVVARVGDGTYVCQRGIERPQDKGFRNVSDEPSACFDMSRNQPIPAQEAAFMSQSLQELASDPRVLQQLTGYTAEAGLARHRVAGRCGCSMRLMSRMPIRCCASTVASMVCCVR